MIHSSHIRVNEIFSTQIILYLEERSSSKDIIYSLTLLPSRNFFPIKSTLDLTQLMEKMSEPVSTE